MAKIVKKIINKSLSVKKFGFKANQKKKERCIMKECTVKLNRMSDSFICHWLNKPNTYSVNIDIKGDRLKANNIEISSASPLVFDIGIKINQGKMFIGESKSAAEKTARPVETLVQSTSEKHMAKTVTQLVNDTWKISVREKKQSKIILKENDIVMAKMRGYSPWPGKIISFTKNLKRAEIYFYGSHNKGSVDVNDMVLFENSHKVIRLQLLRVLSNFTKGILEVEIEMNVPREMSITNSMNALKDK